MNVRLLSARLSLVGLLGAALVGASCDSGFGHTSGKRHLLVSFDPTTNAGNRAAPLGLTVSCIRNVGYMMHHDNGPAASSRTERAGG